MQGSQLKWSPHSVIVVLPEYKRTGRESALSFTVSVFGWGVHLPYSLGEGLGLRVYGS